MPLLFLLLWLVGLFSLLLLGVGGWLVVDGWFSDVRDVYWHRAGYVLLAVALLGRFPLQLLFPKGPRTDDLPSGERQRVPAAGGGHLLVESWGRATGPTLVLTHGWQMDRSLWAATVRALGERYRIVAWDLPGLGGSDKRADGLYDPDRFAEDLDRVLNVAGAPAVLVGHSIGGMTSLSWARVNPDRLGRDVVGLVLVDSTAVQPLETVFAGGFLKAIRKPLLEPLLKFTAAVPGLARVANLMSYLNGTQQLAHRVSGFGAYATRQNLDHVARLATKNSPGVGAQGILGVLRWDAAEVPGRLQIPVRAVVGDLDLITRPDGSRFVADTAPDAELCILEGCGHMGLLERPEDYARSIGEFADRAFGQAQALQSPVSYDVRAGRPEADGEGPDQPEFSADRPQALQ